MTFSMMEYYTLIYNYADDNTVLVTAANKEAAVKKIVQINASVIATNMILLYMP